MRFIPTYLHGILDYLFSIALIAAPWLLHFSAIGNKTAVTDSLAAATITYSLFTKYEWGLFRELRMKIHLAFDLAGGILLIASPWLFGFAHIVYLPHVMLGIFEILVVLCSKTSPGKTWK